MNAAGSTLFGPLQPHSQHVQPQQLVLVLQVVFRHVSGHVRALPVRLLQPVYDSAHNLGTVQHSCLSGGGNA